MTVSIFKLLSLRKCKTYTRCNTRCRCGWYRVLSLGSSSHRRCQVPRGWGGAWELPIQCAVGLSRKDFLCEFREGVEVSFHEVLVEWLWKDGEILGKGKMRKKCMFIKLLISTRHSGEDLVCHRNGPQIGLKVGEAMPEKLASASLILTIIT